jgi:hypothetical protein
MQWINHYSRKDTNHHIKGSDTAANRRTLVIVPFSAVIDDRLGAGRLDTFTTLVDTELDLNTAANWDTVTPTDYTVAVTRAGKDFYIYACIPTSGNVPVIKLSANSTYPSGYTANNSRKIGGFHCLPYVTAPTWLADTVTVLNYVVQPVTPGATKLLYRCTARADDYKTHATTEPTWPTTVGETVVDDQVTWTCDANGCKNLGVSHPYYGFLMGDIMPHSIYDRRMMDNMKCAPEGTVAISNSPSTTDGVFRSDIYIATGVGTTPTSVFGAVPKLGVTQLDHRLYAILASKRLPSISEFGMLAAGSPVGEIMHPRVEPGTITFPVTSTGKSIISNYGVIGACGVLYQASATLITSINGNPDTGDPAFSPATNPTSQGTLYTQNGQLFFAMLGGSYLATPSCGPQGVAAHYRCVSLPTGLAARYIG